MTEKRVLKPYEAAKELDESGDLWIKPTASHDPGGLPVTTIWGIR